MHKLQPHETRCQAGQWLNGQSPEVRIRGSFVRAAEHFMSKAEES